MREEKKYAVDEFRKSIEGNSCAFLTRYTGISSEKLNQVRFELAQRESSYQVVKNRLFSIAASGAGLERLIEHLGGQVGVVFTDDENSDDVLKYLVKFKKENDTLDLLGGVLEGCVYDGEELVSISRLPGLDMMRARFLGTLAAPMSNLAQVFRGRLMSLLYAMNAIIEKRGENVETE